MQWSDYLFFADKAVVEDKLSRWRSAHTHLVDLLTDRKTIHSLFDEKSSDTPRAGFRRRLRIDNKRVGIGCVGDPKFCAVQNIAALNGVRL